MKLTTKQLRQIIKEELQYLYETDEEVDMSDDDVGGFVYLMDVDFDMALELFKSLKRKDLSPNAEQSVAQAIWYNTTGFWNDPKWIALRTALRNAEQTGFYHKIAPAEKALDDFNAEAQRKIDQFADLLGMSGRDFWDHIDVGAIDTLQKFQVFLKKQGVL